MKSEIQTDMDTRPVPPASVTVASILSILASGGVLIISLLLGLSARGAPPKNGAQITAHSRMILQAVSYVLLAAGVLGVVNGISLLALQNWARRMTVIASGLTVIVSTYCLYMGLAFLGVPPATNLSSQASHILWSSFFGVSLLVFGLSLWFTALFTRPATIASFTWSTGEAGLAKNPAPACPLPLSLLAGFFIVGAIVSLLLLRASDRMPDMLFGHALFGKPRAQYVTLMAILSIGSAIGLFLVKTWGIYLGIVLQLFSVANHAVTFLSPRSLPSLREALAAMAAQGAKPPLHDPSIGFHYLEGLGLSFALALLVILLQSRAKFMIAASTPETLP